MEGATELLSGPRLLTPAVFHFYVAQQHFSERDSRPLGLREQLSAVPAAQALLLQHILARGEQPQEHLALPALPGLQTPTALRILRTGHQAEEKTGAGVGGALRPRFGEVCAQFLRCKAWISRYVTAGASCVLGEAVSPLQVEDIGLEQLAVLLRTELDLKQAQLQTKLDGIEALALHEACCASPPSLSPAQMALFCQTQHSRKTTERGSEVDVLCDVCGKEEFTQKNKIYFCAKCPMRVHRFCYVFIDCPEDAFVCDVCAEPAVGDVPACLFCPAPGGAMRKVQLHPSAAVLPRLNARSLCSVLHPVTSLEATADSPGGSADSSLKGTLSTADLPPEPLPEPRTALRTAWVHLSCLYWTAPLSFKQSGAVVTVKNLGGIPREALTAICCVCGAEGGACVGCSEGACARRYHVECGRRADCHLFVNQNRKYGSMCAAHSPVALPNALILRERRRDEEVRRYLRHARLLLPQGLSPAGETPPVPRAELTQLIAMQEREEADAFLVDEEALSIFRRVKLLLREEREFFVRINLRKETHTDGYAVLGVQSGSRNFLDSELSPAAVCIRRVAKERNQSCEWIHRKFTVMRRVIRLKLENENLQRRCSVSE